MSRFNVVRRSGGRYMRARRAGVSGLVIMMAMLGGCGQKGPLVRPDDASVRPPAPAAPAGGDATAEDDEENRNDGR